MDIDEWEILPMDGLIEFREGGDPDEKIFPQKFMGSYYDPKGVLDTDYFRCPRSNSRMPKQLVPVSIHLDPLIASTGNRETVLELPGKDDPVRIAERAMDPEQGMASKVFFKKMKENEFVDMKLDSPRSSSPTSRGIVVPQVEAGNFQFDDGGENLVSVCSPRKKPWKEPQDLDCDGHGAKEEGVAWEGSKGGFNMWKWSLNGIGALCSFGFAAATICIFIMGSGHQNKSQKIQLQIYADDKRMKQVVHHASRLNEAISAMQGCPMARAHITFGGYYEGH
ncbi:hypothetical protein MLD38_028866 [Melastoma candidum]|uniref:Uncharacterized protein n=1 Tax=Melastoma candidum TaxID=119954 RepID=A0ACB9N804_9MYRT|nr:hypothetical protein MLD38_028866 [Melastoma candidum]